MTTNMQYWCFGLVSELTYKPKEFVFDDLGLSLNNQLSFSRFLHFKNQSFLCMSNNWTVTIAFIID